MRKSVFCPPSWGGGWDCVADIVGDGIGALLDPRSLIKTERRPGESYWNTTGCQERGWKRGGDQELLRGWP